MQEAQIEELKKKIDYYLNLFFFELKSHQQELDYLNGCVFEINKLLYAGLTEEENIRSKDFRLPPEKEEQFRRFREYWTVVRMHNKVFNKIYRREERLKFDPDNIKIKKELVKLKEEETELKAILDNTDTNFFT
jgi:hypothetical protein